MLPYEGLWQRLQRSFGTAGAQRFELMIGGGVAVATIVFILSIDSLWEWKNRGVRPGILLHSHSTPEGGRGALIRSIPPLIYSIGGAVLSTSSPLSLTTLPHLFVYPSEEV